MRKYWASWLHNASLGEFELHSPWWISGVVDDEADSETICAAIIAKNEDDVKLQVNNSYDKKPENLVWRFCEERPDDWKPGDRFPFKKWMVWPDNFVGSDD